MEGSTTNNWDFTSVFENMHGQSQHIYSANMMASFLKEEQKCTESPLKTGRLSFDGMLLLLLLMIHTFSVLSLQLKKLR